MTPWANGKRLLFVDIETYCEVDLKTCGGYRYVEDPSFEVNLFGFAYDDEEAQTVDLLQGESIPESVMADLHDPTIVKVAHNANFEITCLTKWFMEDMDPKQWYCTAVRAATLGLPRSLEAVGDALGLPEDEKKLKVGMQLIQYFAKPCAPTKTNGGRTRNLPRHEPEKWALYKKYNCGDVTTERSIYKRMLAYPDIPEHEHRLWEVDQRINAAGTTVDTVLTKNILEYGAKRTEALQQEAKRISGLGNTNSMPQIKRWLRTKGIAAVSFDKDAVTHLSKTVTDPDVLRFLQIRQELGKTSVAKYDAMQRALCSDGRVRGMLQFYGANRTGRWAGRIVQLQNLPRNELDDIDLPRRIVRSGDFELLELLYDSPMDVFSQLVRTAFIAGTGKTFVVADYSAIEARVIAWIAGEEWRLQAFREGKDIYCASASQMFGVPVIKNGTNCHLRKKGKVAELACIAEKTQIQTNRGLIRIEDLQSDDLVYDGENYVHHDGLIFKGYKEVIEYDELRATADHLVWCEGEAGPVPFGEAAAGNKNLLRPGDSRENLWKGKDNIAGKAVYKNERQEGVRFSVCSDGMPFVWEAGMDPVTEPDQTAIIRMPELHTSATGSDLALQKSNGAKAEMRESERPGLQQLRGARDTVQFFERPRWSPVDNGEPRPASGDGTGPDRQQWKLRAGKHSVHIKAGKQLQQADDGHANVESGRMAILQNGSRENAEHRDDSTGNSPKRGNDREGEKKKLARHCGKVKVYDILNCGPNHRYVANGAIVHNCGYQGGVGAMKRMGGEQMGLTDAEMQEIVDNWRAKNPKIVELWAKAERAAKNAILHPGTVQHFSAACFFQMIGKHLFMTLPSGRRICYNGARVEQSDKNQFRSSIKYMGQDQESGGWGLIETYGGKLVENCIQSIARDCLGEAMIRLDDAGYRPEFHIHDEVVIPVPTENAEKDLERITNIMALEDLPWKSGLPLRADGYVTEYYKKD